jgi:hypothetical protein
MFNRYIAPFVGTLFLAACGDAKDPVPPADAAAGGADTAAAVTYQTVKPLFEKKCTPCHTPGGQAADAHTLGAEYRTATNPATAPGCTGKKIGECTILVVKSGFMPLGKGCSGNPAMDTGKDACLTAAEQKQLEDWIANGLAEK